MEKEVPPYLRLVEIAMGIEDLCIRSLFIVAYLTGGRINEILPKRFILRQKMDKDTKIVTKWKEEINYEGIRKTDIELENHDGNDMMLINMINEKNKNTRFKKIPVYIEKEREMVDMFKSWLDVQVGVLFPFTDVTAWRKLKKIGFNPHLFRHFRTTHLITRYNLPDSLIIKHMGWSDGRPLSRYSHLRWTDIADGLTK